MKRDFTEEERKAIAEYSRKIVNPTPEEKDESTRKYEENWAKFRARHRSRRQRIYQHSQPSRKFKFFGIGWWNE